VSFSFIGVGRPLEPSIQLQYNTRGLSVTWWCRGSCLIERLVILSKVFWHKACCDVIMWLVLTSTIGRYFSAW